MPNLYVWKSQRKKTGPLLGPHPCQCYVRSMKMFVLLTRQQVRDNKSRFKLILLEYHLQILFVFSYLFQIELLVKRLFSGRNLDSSYQMLTLLQTFHKFFQDYNIFMEKIVIFQTIIRLICFASSILPTEMSL